MLFNEQFLRSKARQIVPLYLYVRLREYAAQRGGYIDGFKLTKREQYNILPILVEWGVLSNDKRKILSHRKATKRGQWNITYVMVTKDDIASLNDFKGFLVGMVERSIMESDVDSQENNDPKWNAKGLHCLSNSPERGGIFKKRMSEDGSVCEGMVTLERVAQKLGISTRTVKRWRKYSPNQYFTDYYTIERLSITPRSLTKRDKEKYLEGKDFALDYRNELDRAQCIRNIEAISAFLSGNVIANCFLRKTNDFGYETVAKRTGIRTAIVFVRPKVLLRESACWKRYY